MLSIRLQSGGERSAAGQLRLMTAQHHAQQQQQQHPSLDPQLLAAYQQQQQQRRALANVANTTVAGAGLAPPPVVGLQQQQQQPQPPIPQAQQQLGAVPPQPPQVPGAIPYSQTAATAARVAAALAKSAQGAAAPPQPPRAQQFYGHNPNLKLPPELCLLGCIFYFVGYENEPDLNTWKTLVRRSGGEVEETYVHRVTHVICDTQKNSFVQQALRDSKRCVTPYWLSDALEKQQVVPPSLAVHFPRPYKVDEKPCNNHVISYSGFEKEERRMVHFMIVEIGAKPTAYFSRENHILVCRRPDGQKYKKAREWGKPVVNVQWLTDILFGQYSCIQQPDNPKYQQFNLVNPFRVEYALIPNLMAAWKMPINITQESYDKLQKNPPSQRRHKRARLDFENSVVPPVEEEPLGEVAVTNPDPPPPDKRPRFMLSGLSTENEVTKKLLQLGCEKAASCKEATHLIMPNLVRTLKLMCCLSTCQYILSVAWVHDSHAQNKILDEKPYILDDPTFEKKFDCNIPKLLEKPNRRELFKGITFFMTPGINPSPSALAEMIECAGGTVEKRRKALRNYALEARQDGRRFVIISVKHDMHLLLQCFPSGYEVYNSECVMGSIMRQELMFS